jgi:hypothetical protein
MSYIGNEPNVGTFIVGVERFNGTGSCTQFTLTQTGIQDPNAIEVLVNSIQQDPTNSYSVANGVITFTEAPSTGANNIIVTYRATTVITYGNIQGNQILDGSITLSKLASGVLPDAKANSAAVYANGAFISANSAGVYANAAFAQANTGGAGASYANSAFLQANTPSYVANSAATYANSAFATANSASLYANSAFTKANNAGSNGSFSVTGTGIAVSLVGTAITGYKILGQIVTTANSISNVYVVPAATSAAIGTITVCNGTATDVLFDLVMRPSTEALATKHYLLKSITVPAADTLIIDSGVTLNTGAILAANTIGGNASAAAAGISVHAYGVEIV